MTQPNTELPPGSILDLSDYSNERLESVLTTAADLKHNRIPPVQASGTMLGLVFFNSSLRTRVSFEAAATHLGATTSTIQPGSGSWPLETKEGVVMDGDKTEHVKEAIPVLARYCDALGVRAFAGKEDYETDRSDAFIRTLSAYSNVPFLNLESAAAHPFQGLADWLTIKELFGAALPDRKMVIRWAPHPSPLPMAVPNTAVQVAARAGMEVELNCPEEFLLDEEVIRNARNFATENGGSFSVTHDNQNGLKDAHVVYVKSWGAPLLYDDPETEHRLRTETYRDWTVNNHVMAASDNAKVMHCLPVRRNVVISDEVLDHPNAVHIDQAENRLHAQKAWLHQLWSG